MKYPNSRATKLVSSAVAVLRMPQLAAIPRQQIKTKARKAAKIRLTTVNRIPSAAPIAPQHNNNPIIGYIPLEEQADKTTPLPPFGVPPTRNKNDQQTIRQKSVRCGAINANVV
jgi:hypothetical protein